MRFEDGKKYDCQKTDFVAGINGDCEKVPCANKVIPLAIAETEAGNILLVLDKVSMLPDETYYICQFKYFSKTRPRGLKKE